MKRGAETRGGALPPLLRASVLAALLALALAGGFAAGVQFAIDRVLLDDPPEDAARPGSVPDERCARRERGDGACRWGA